MKSAVIYARYSSDKQTEQSIEGQLHVCYDYAKRNDIVVLDTYIDRAMTGTNDNRTAFQRMLHDSNKRAWDYVLVYKLDRFSRNKYEMATHKRTLRDNGIKLISCMENIPDTPEGIILESLLEGMAEYYSAELSQKVRRGMNETRHKGNSTGGRILFGYRTKAKRIVIQEDEAEVVRWMFNECASGKLVKTIYQELNEKGILHNGKPFRRSTVYDMFSNEKYIGIYRHGNEVFTNIYPRIVPQEIFEIVKSKIDSNKNGKHIPDIVYLLKNKVRCGYCGKRVSSDAGTSGNGIVMRYYKCTGKRAPKELKCSLNPIRKETLENLVLETTLEVFATPDNISLFADQVMELYNKANNDNSVLNLLKADYNQIEKAISNILDCMEQGMATESTKQRLMELENRRSALSESILIEQSKERAKLTRDDIIKHVVTTLRKSPRQLLDLLIKEVRLYNDKIEIDFHFVDNKSPDDKTRWDFCIYKCKKSYTKNPQIWETNSTHVEVEIQLYI